MRRDRARRVATGKGKPEFIYFCYILFNLFTVHGDSKPFIMVEFQASGHNFKVLARLDVIRDYGDNYTPPGIICVLTTVSFQRRPTRIYDTVEFKEILYFFYEER